MTTRLKSECLKTCVPLARVVVRGGEAPILVEALKYLKDTYQVFRDVKSIITDACPTESSVLDIVYPEKTKPIRGTCLVHVRRMIEKHVKKIKRSSRENRITMPNQILNLLDERQATIYDFTKLFQSEQDLCRRSNIDDVTTQIPQEVVQTMVNNRAAMFKHTFNDQ